MSRNNYENNKTKNSNVKISHAADSKAKNYKTKSNNAADIKAKNCKTKSSHASDSKVKNYNLKNSNAKNHDTNKENEPSNIVLIGMPGCGKSTVGVVLAKAMGYQFIDCDLLIQKHEGKILSELIAANGVAGFHEIENRVISTIEADENVIATGGSAIYGKDAMAHLREIGWVVYLKLPYEEIEERLGDLHQRGITIEPGETLRDLYNQRVPLYEKYAHQIVDTQGLILRESVAKIIEIYGENFRKI
ncbi:MAG: shikimate kinase [Anaerovoracaceae bacterium]|jgi:shikimate kinase|nr:shikimate kinase [Anaerovoracaceae bacterium]